MGAWLARSGHGAPASPPLRKRLPLLTRVALLLCFLAASDGQATAAASSAQRSPTSTTLAPSQRREPPLPAPREETAAAALAGRLYVIGGFDQAGSDTDTVFVFDRRRWTAGPHLPLGLDHSSAAVAGGRLFVAGGFHAGSASGATFVLAPSGRSWVQIGRLRHARGALALIGLGDALYALGGRDSTGAEVGPVEVYRSGSGTWSDLRSLPAPRDHLAGFTYRGWACVAGGRSPNTARVDCYDPRARIWRQLPQLPVATSGAGAARLGRDVLVGGGELPGEGGTIIAQLARLHQGKWTADRMLIPRHGLQFAVYGGRIWACGGGIRPGLHAVSTCTSIG
jgi:non-specific serine/threonine protein kinase